MILKSKNINNRLKRLEINFVNNEIEFCQCYDKHFVACLNKAYGEPFAVSDVLPDNVPVTDYCERCKKPVEERIKNLYRDIEEIYGEGSLNAP